MKSLFLRDPRDSFLLPTQPKGWFQDAMDGYAKIIASNYYDRSTVNALNNRGRMKVEHGDTLGGLKDLRKSLSIMPTASALLSIGALQSHRDSVLRYSQRARAIAPEEWLKGIPPPGHPAIYNICRMIADTSTIMK